MPLSTPPRFAAEYLRMSTDLQCYSLDNQRSRIREYATEHALSIVRTYTDGGRSGLLLQRRAGLQTLLADVIGGNAPFDVILVYDISRWGRFQDADEAAHYEFICRKAGKRVIYCAEPFENDGTPIAAIVKGLKRVMAGEYSRELSDKVHRGLIRLASLGFHVGSRAAYGTRRMLIDRNGEFRGSLEFGERKAMQDDHVVLVLGPKEEVEVVHRVFDWFTEEGWNYQQIADKLNEQKVKPPVGSQYWSRYQIKGMLSNVKYTGMMVYNRTSSKLSTPRIHNPRSKWIEVYGAFAPLITQDQFDEASLRRDENPRRHRKKDLIAHLQRVLAEHGYLSGVLLRRLKSGPAPNTYVQHFGSIDAAFSAAGYERSEDPRRSVRRHCATRVRLEEIVPTFAEELAKMGYGILRESLSSLRVNGEFRVTITFPLLVDGRKLRQIHLDKRAAVVVVMDFLGSGEACLVLDPNWYPRRTISLSSSSQLQKVSPWRCEFNEVPAKICQLLQLSLAM